MLLPYYHVVYIDGDEEDLNTSEVKEHLSDQDFYIDTRYVPSDLRATGRRMGTEGGVPGPKEKTALSVIGRWRLTVAVRDITAVLVNIGESDNDPDVDGAIKHVVKGVILDALEKVIEVSLSSPFSCPLPASHFLVLSFVSSDRPRWRRSGWSPRTRRSRAPAKLPYHLIQKRMLLRAEFTGSGWHS